MIGLDKHYLQVQKGKLFFTGDYPVETLLPMMHMDAAGFYIDVATFFGNSIKLEM